jgi:protein SCO1/2
MPRSTRRAKRRPLLLLASLALMLLAAGALYASLRSQASAPLGGEFRLIAGDGRVVTDRDFPGKALLIYFGYTNCPDVCPETLRRMADAVDQLGPGAAHVQPLFITIDPAHDTPDTMRRYTAAISPRLIGLTGGTDAIHAAERAFRVTATPAGDDSMDHSALLYLVRPGTTGAIPLPPPHSAAQLAAELRASLAPG